jgi:predicted kinase
MARAAADRAIAFLGLWLEAPTDVLKKRVAERRGDPSDATIRIVDTQIAQIEMPADWTLIDASGAPERTLALANEAPRKLSTRRGG